MTDVGKPKVLVVDDEKIIADTLTIILNRSGYVARAEYSGEKAIETALSFQPDVLISDVVMPGITGIEAAIQVRTILPSCKVMLFSGQAGTAYLIEKARAQKQEFEILVKPVQPDDLLARLRSALPM